MNIFNGKIESITTNGNLSLVTVNVNGFLFKSIVIDTLETASYLKKGKSIDVIFKATEVIISNNKDSEISLQNKLDGEIVLINEGKLLSNLTINTPIGKITAIITSNAVNNMQLDVGKKIIAMVKTNEIMLSE